jgi:hypothetical protein
MLQFIPDKHHHLFQPLTPYEPEKIQIRNEWMVNHVDLILALWNGRKSGDVWNCLAYAQFRLKPIKNHWDEWVRTRAEAFPEFYPTLEITYELNFLGEPHVDASID